MPKRPTALRALLAATLASGLSAGLAAPALAHPGHTEDDSMREKLGFARALSDVFKRAAEIIEPSVVHITTQQRGSRRGAMMSRTVQGLGSGVVLTDNGYVLTNNHVVAGADRLIVRLPDQRELQAELVGRDPDTDLAVLKVDASGLTPAEFAHAPVDVGEWVLAAGSPFGLTSSVTQGIVSATGRTGLVRGRDAFEDFIQTDAAVNPGNSGGPLINLDGQVVGINTAIYSRSGGSNGISFAIPSAIAERVVGDLIDRGEVARGFLGVAFVPVTPELARDRGIPRDRGVYITRVEPDSPADRSGLRTGDVVTRLDGRDVSDDNRFRTLIGLAKPGEGLPASVLRDGRPITLTLAIGDQRNEAVRRFEELAKARNLVAVPELGLLIGPIARDDARDLARRLDLDEPPVAFVVDVNRDLTDDRRLLRGDIITAVDGEPVTKPEDIAQALREGARRIDLVRADRRGAMRGYVTLDE